MSGPAQHTIHRAHIHHGWNNAFPPILKIAPGETVHFETVDASSGQITPQALEWNLRSTLRCHFSGSANATKGVRPRMINAAGLLTTS